MTTDWSCWNLTIPVPGPSIGASLIVNNITELFSVHLFIFESVQIYETTLLDMKKVLVFEK